MRPSGMERDEGTKRGKSYTGPVGGEQTFISGVCRKYLSSIRGGQEHINIYSAANRIKQRFTFQMAGV